MIHNCFNRFLIDYLIEKQISALNVIEAVLSYLQRRALEHFSGRPGRLVADDLRHLLWEVFRRRRPLRRGRYCDEH